ncbi:hypothetical protein BT96DRAFT_868551 [Gymnopus androsaceus JB14]|uniref:N-acetyltransferase domain-containing protein n=1 Tax=Gymnopus androsaceus JB14 TaxID=1447944 RepID=A0A6A4GIJ1_9AGAR|nr:hypothetical protein BT96DRAFT_868551 [Gymnopus androsaceus JB14]
MVDQSPFTVRLAKRTELDAIIALNQRAYINSPVQNYLAGLSIPITTDTKDASLRRNQEKYLRLLYRRAFNGARLTVVVHSESGSSPDGPDKERIVASSIWKLPSSEKAKIRKSFLDVISTELLVIPIVMSWGIGFVRKALGPFSALDKAAERVYKERNVKESRDEQYYLEMVAVDPEFHGKGLMSLLFREAFDYAPSSTYTLFANGPLVRDRYAHWGFETWAEITIGKDECDAAGLSKPSGSGFQMYFMVKNPPQKST